MARIVCIVGIIVAALLLPGLSVLTSQANVGVDVREAWFYGFAVIGLAIMGMGALFRYGFGVGDRQISEEQLTRWKTGIRSPSNWIGTFASIAALMIMGIDYSGPFYEPVIEAIVLPLAIGAMGTLLVIAFVRYRRNSNLSVPKDDPRYVAVNQFPVFFSRWRSDETNLLTMGDQSWTAFARDGLEAHCANAAPSSAVGIA